MVNDVFAMLLAQAPLVTVTILILILYFERRFSGLQLSIESRFSSIESRLQGLEFRLDMLLDRFNTLVDFNDILLSTLYSRGVLGDIEFNVLSALLAHARPSASSRYYTREVAEKLDRILAKKPEEFTWDDVFELERIYEILLMEASISSGERRRELVSYAGKLRAFKALVMGLLMRRGVMPPPRRHS